MLLSMSIWGSTSSILQISNVIICTTETSLPNIILPQDGRKLRLSSDRLSWSSREWRKNILITDRYTFGKHSELLRIRALRDHTQAIKIACAFLASLILLKDVLLKFQSQKMKQQLWIETILVFWLLLWYLLENYLSPGKCKVRAATGGRIISRCCQTGKHRFAQKCKALSASSAWLW